MMVRVKSLATLGVVLALSALIGSSAAVALDGRSVPTVQAANHCTRYAPATAPDTSCGVQATIFGSYQNSSYAWRDSNLVSLAASRDITMYLFDTLGNTYQFFAANTNAHTTGGVGSAQTKALCFIDDSAVSGRCMTEWHD